VALRSAEGDVLRLAEQIDAARTGRRELVLPSGVRMLDEQIGGLQPSVLTLVGALPGVGKSALLATILRNVANGGRKVGLFSLEDERGWVTKRLAAIEAGVSVFAIGTRPLTHLENQRVTAAYPEVYRTLENVVIDDRPGLSPAEIVQTAREMILHHGCKAILVDHLGEVRLPRSERYDLDIAEALSAFRDLAKRYAVPVVVASHVKRRVGLDVEDPPRLTDFANSSAPERMARVALGLSKPFTGCVRVSVLKQTNGCSGQVLDLALVRHAAMVDSELSATAPPEAEP
jgi:replicative DNA helicase